MELFWVILVLVMLGVKGLPQLASFTPKEIEMYRNEPKKYPEVLTAGEILKIRKQNLASDEFYIDGERFERAPFIADRVYVINLKSAKRRRRYMKRQLIELGIPRSKIRFIEGVDGL